MEKLDNYILDKYIKECNLVFTNTIDNSDFNYVDFDIDKIDVKYKNSINLFHLVSSFNKLYLSFKKEYDQLEKLDLGKSVEVLRFDKFKFGDNYRSLILYIDSPIITNHEDTFLYLREINGEMKPFVTNDINIFDEGYYCEDLELNNEIGKKYLDLFEKYSLFLDAYNNLKNSQLFGDGTNSIYTVIDNYKSNLLDGLRTFKISFGSSYFLTNYYAELLINLGDNFGLDYDKCKIVLDRKDMKPNKEVYRKVLNNVYLNKKYTKV